MRPVATCFSSKGEIICRASAVSRIQRSDLIVIGGDHCRGRRSDRYLQSDAELAHSLAPWRAAGHGAVPADTWLRAVNCEQPTSPAVTGTRIAAVPQPTSRL